MNIRDCDNIYERYSKLRLKNSPNLLLLINKAGYVDFMSDAFLRLIGNDKSKLILNQPFSEIYKHFSSSSSAQKGMDFIIKSLDVLNPGGISVHTTEFNLSSNETIDVPFNAIYGRHFFDNLRIEIERRGHVFEPVDYRLGDNPKEDDVQYYNQPQKPHIKVSAYGTVFTSIGITIKKAKLKNR